MTKAFGPSQRLLAALAATAVLAACGGGGGGSSTPAVVNTPAPTFTTPAPTPTPANVTAFTCPPNDASANAGARSVAYGSDAVRRANGLRTSHPAAPASGRLVVTYNAAALGRTTASAMVAREQATGANVVSQLTFSHLGQVAHVLAVPTAQMNAVAASLRSQAGVVSVTPGGGRRYVSKVNAGYFPNDPYFDGFTGSQTPPYYETAVIPGQWDMHAIKLEDAFAYSQASNGSGKTVAGALGSSSVKIAIIDTGADPTHPELSSKIAYQKCFITNTSNVQSISNFETDPTGHGTDVAGIAAESTGNAFGFTAAGGNSVIYAYRVFPTPDDNCSNPSTTDPQCSSDTADIAAAITDAVQQGVNVISMSLGGGSCTNGVDSDPMENKAVANAIVAHVIVVAASGNAGGSGLEAPACDTGVIAVGASALADGSPNGSGVPGGTASAPIEYVASYSQYGSTNTPHSASSWGIVAPGGDPGGNTDTDDLHWIENIWTSTPYMSSSSDTNFSGECTDDYPASTGVVPPVDCRTLIAGTSMATPHVAGVAALILAATGGFASIYQSPAAMLTLLCQTADNIGGNQGCGRLNAYTAMATAVGDPAAPTPIP